MTHVRTSRNSNYLRKLRKLLREIPAQPAPELVHQLRTTIRRTEILLSSHGLSGMQDGAKLLDQLNKLRRRAGRVRDVDVQIAALRAVHIGRQEDTKLRLMAELEHQRGKQQKKLVAAIEDKFSDRMRARMQRLEAAVSSINQSGVQKKPRLSPVRLWRSVKELIRAAHEAQPFTPRVLHQFRIQCKRTRYLAELLPGTDDLIQQLKTVQDSIGDWHDWLTLTQNATKIADTGESALLAHLENVTQAKFADAIRLSKHIIARLEADVDSLKVVREAQGPGPEKAAEPEKKKVQPEKDNVALPDSSAAGKQATPATG